MLGEKGRCDFWGTLKPTRLIFPSLANDKLPAAYLTRISHTASPGNPGLFAVLCMLTNSNRQARTKPAARPRARIRGQAWRSTTDRQVRNIRRNS